MIFVNFVIFGHFIYFGRFKVVFVRFVHFGIFGIFATFGYFNNISILLFDMPFKKILSQYNYIFFIEEPPFGFGSIGRTVCEIFNGQIGSKT